MGFLLSTIPLLLFFIALNIYYLFKEEKPVRDHGYLNVKDFYSNSRDASQRVVDNSRLLNRSKVFKDDVKDFSKEIPTSTDPVEIELPSCFGVLGLSKYPTEDELKAAYRELARVHHPDRGGDPKDFEEISKAYSEARKYI